MDIRSITPGLIPSEAAATRRADESGRASEGNAAEATRQQAGTAELDEVRISKGPQAGTAASGEFTVARAALDHSEGLSDERRAEILGRIRSGYYKDPSVTAQVAEKMADALKGGKQA